MPLRPSFERRYSADGWRYSVGHRTRPVSVSDGTTGWEVQKWNGEHWVTVGIAKSYDGARTVAAGGDFVAAEARS